MVHELRWNPITREWVIMVTERQGRPVFLEGFCPFDPGASEVPEDYEVLSIPNRFPSLRRDAPDGAKADNFFKTAPAAGACEVVLYSGNHETSLGDEPVSHIKKVVDLWQQRYLDLSREPHVRYVFIFENRGREIGVTLDHPHGQIYAYPFIPPFIERRLEGARRYHLDTGRCLFCDIIEKERKASPSRIILENDHFIALVPFWAKWSYEVNIYPRRHLGGLDEIGEGEKWGLVKALKKVLLKYDGLYGFRLPFVMAIHQRPTGGTGGCYYCHMSVEFYPPHRSRDRLKYLGGSEMGAGAHINVTSPEEAADQLRRVQAPDID